MMPWMTFPCSVLLVHRCGGARRAYNCCKKLIQLSLIPDEDSAKLSAVLLGYNSAMDDIPFFSPASGQVWRAYNWYISKSMINILELSTVTVTVNYSISPRVIK
jgi:hypothetical protein